MNAPIRHGHIADLCIALAHRWEPDRIFVILTAYLDESGTHDGSPVTIMGGVLANARQWEAFEREFSRIKSKHGFKIFHTKKFKKRNGDFSGWSNERCLALIEDLAKVTCSAFTEGVAVTVDNAKYESDYKAGEKPRKLRLDSAYGLCFRQCLFFFVLEGEKRQYKKRFPKLHFVLESGHPNAGDALRIFNEVKKDLQRVDCDMLGDIIFSDKDQCDPLMMADFLAHSTFTSEVRVRDGQPGLIRDRPVPRGETGVTHLEFGPAGLANLKAALVERLRPKNASVQAPGASGEQSS